MDADTINILLNRIEQLRDALEIEHQMRCHKEPFRCNELDCPRYGQAVRRQDCKCRDEMATKHYRNVQGLLRGAYE